MRAGFRQRRENARGTNVGGDFRRGHPGGLRHRHAVADPTRLGRADPLSRGRVRSRGDSRQSRAQPQWLDRARRGQDRQLDRDALRLLRGLARNTRLLPALRQRRRHHLPTGDGGRGHLDHQGDRALLGRSSRPRPRSIRKHLVAPEPRGRCASRPNAGADGGSGDGRGDAPRSADPGRRAPNARDTADSSAVESDEPTKRNLTSVR
jgi:hypothetical protein